MDMLVLVFIIILLLLLVILFVWSRRLERQIVERDKKINALIVEKSKIYQDCQTDLAEAQKMVDQQILEIKAEADRIRKHYENEVQKANTESELSKAKLKDELDSLRKFSTFWNSEAEMQRALSEALQEATVLRSEAKALHDAACAAAEYEKGLAVSKVQETYEQADARLNQATREAGRIIADAEKRAQQIGRDAYGALKEKQMLENASEALRNVVDGYGDRYIIPTHSLIDDLAVEFGYTSAGEALKSAREQSRRMVEQGEAASCDYVESGRRETAIRFVVDAFNGRVDAILSRSKSDNYGTLAQEIQDACSLVNLNGKAFKDARILPLYRDSRLAELKWAVVVQELAMRQREEQRYLREKARDEQRAREEQERHMREAQHEEELKKSALAEAEAKLATAHAEEKALLAQEVQKLAHDLEEARKKTETIAQKTREGNVYIISNIGSFGEGVFKIGLTRRDIEERVYELSGASVPFEFDIVGVIKTENAPELEHMLHQRFLAARVNKMNPRKEFFRIRLTEIRDEIERLKKTGEKLIGVESWPEKAIALQYYESLNIDKGNEAREKWLQREKAQIERRKRLGPKIPMYNTLAIGNAEGKFNT